MNIQFPSPDRLARQTTFDNGLGLGRIILMSVFFVLSFWSGVTAFIYLFGACWVAAAVVYLRESRNSWLIRRRGTFLDVTFTDTEVVLGTGPWAWHRPYADILSVAVGNAGWVRMGESWLNPQGIEPLLMERWEKSAGQELGLRQITSLVFVFRDGNQATVTLRRPTEKELSDLTALLTEHGWEVRPV